MADRGETDDVGSWDSYCLSVSVGSVLPFLLSRGVSVITSRLQ